jgi:hypothetical protein
MLDRIWLDRSAPVCLLKLLEPRLVESHSPIVIPFDDRVIVIRLLNRAQFSRRPSEVAQTLDAIAGTKFLIGGRRFDERWFPGAVCVT